MNAKPKNLRWPKEQSRSRETRFSDGNDLRSLKRRN